MATPKLRWYCYLLALAAAGTLAACSGDKSAADNSAEPIESGPLSGRVTVDGSATVFPLSQGDGRGVSANRTRRAIRNRILWYGWRFQKVLRRTD